MNSNCRVTIVRWTTAFNVLLLLFVEVGEIRGADRADDQRKQSIEQAVRKWQELFGPVDFGERNLFACMTYLHQQPKEKYAKFQSEILSKEIVTMHDIWVRRMFKGQFLEAVLHSNPSMYFLNGAEGKASLLYYEIAFQERRI